MVEQRIVNMKFSAYHLNLKWRRLNKKGRRVENGKIDMEQ